MFPALPRNIATRPFATYRSIVALMLREMVTTFGRSPGGYAWAVIEPVAAIALLSVIFSYAFRSPALGTNFPLFYASAFLPFMLFNDVSNKIGTTIRFSRPLLMYPSVTFLDAILARFFLNLLTHLMVTYIVLTGIVLIFSLSLIIDFPVLINAIAMAAALALGVGTLNCYLMTAYPLWERVWQIATRPLFILSGLFFLFEDLPEQFRQILWFNPLFHVTGAARAGLYATYDATYVSPIFVYSVACVSLCLGLLFLKRYHRDLLTML